MQNLTCRFLFAAFLLLLACPLASQIEDPAAGELLENFFRDSDQASESDVQAVLEYLEQLREKPLDLNRANREELLSMRLISPLQIEQFLQYREQFGKLLNVYELQAVPGWDTEVIRRILPYIRTGTGLDQRSTSLIKGLWKGDNELLYRWSTPIPSNETAAFEGNPQAMAFRWRHQYDNRVRFGLTAEKDPGEALFTGSNKAGFDFYSAHLFLFNLQGPVKVLALGDYTVRMGQGLLVQTGFAPGKSAESVMVFRGGRKFSAYNSFGEIFFLRGAATTLQFGKDWEFSLFYSNRLRDGNAINPVDTLDEDELFRVFTSLQTSGFHRTNAEIEDEKSIRETMAGGSFGKNWRFGHVHVNTVYTEYDRNWEPAYAAYREFAFSGKRLLGLSADYNLRGRNLLFFGETARSDNGGMATVNGLLFGPDRRVTIALVQRHLERNYQAIYAAPFAETAGPGNESGLYAGLEMRPSKPWKINAYLDLWRHPWLRFGVDGPSRGWEYLARVLWTPQRGVSFYALWQSENKERTELLGTESGLAGNIRQRFRLHAVYKLSQSLEMRSRIEWTRFRIDDQSSSLGFVAYQEAVIKALGFPVYGSARFTLYDTETFDARVYTYENDLFAALSVPVFSGRGSRYFINLTWRVNDWLRLESRFEQTIEQLVVTSGRTPGARTILKLQARANF